MIRCVDGRVVPRRDVGDDVARAEVLHRDDLVEDDRPAVDRRLHRPAHDHVALIAEERRDQRRDQHQADEPEHDAPQPAGDHEGRAAGGCGRGCHAAGARSGVARR